MKISRLSRATGVWTFSTAAALLAPALVVVACSSSDTSGTTPLLTGDAGSTTGTGDHGDGGTTLADGAVRNDGSASGPFDAGAEQPAIDTLCAKATLLGKSEEVVVEITSTAPPTGGTVMAGTYTLGSLYQYVAPPELGTDAGAVADAGDDAGGDDDDDDDDSSEYLGDLVESETLVLGTDGLYSLATATGTLDAGVGATVITAGVYVVSGDTITFHGTCPGMTETTATFYASGGLLVLYDPTSGVAVNLRQVDAPGDSP